MLNQYESVIYQKAWRRKIITLLSKGPTNRKVAGSIPAGVIGIFRWHNPSDRTMALGSTQPLTEMSTRSISWGVKAAGAYGWQPYHHPVPLSWNLGTLTSWNPLGHSGPVMGLIHLFLLSIEPKKKTVAKYHHHVRTTWWWKDQFRFVGLLQIRVT